MQILILEILTSVGLCPKIFKQTGNILLLIEINDINVRIVNSNNYIPGTEFDLAEYFEIPYIPHFFPNEFLTFENLEFYGNIPHFNYFLSPSDNDALKAKKHEFYSKQAANAWCLKKEIVTNACLKLQLLAIAMLSFLRECFEFQNQLQSNSDELEIKKHFVNPFNAPIVSMGGLMYNIYGTLYLNSYDVYCVQNEYGCNQKTVSRTEHQYVTFMHFKNPQANLKSAFSSEHGQKFFKEAVPDLYCEDTKRAWFMMGCVIHGHMSDCLLNPNAKETTLNPFGKSFAEINSEMETKLQNLLVNNPNEISEIIIHWECQFKKEMQTSPELQNFLKHHYVLHPLQRLVPRHAHRGAFLDCYAMKWSSNMFPNETFYALDINGLYSYCAIKHDFMIGKYEIIMGTKLSNLSIVNNIFCYNNQRVKGAIFLRILPPRNLKYPFLMYRLQDGSNVNTLCTKCAELRSRTLCKHSEEERALIGTYMITEVEFALNLGYEILTIFEVHAYFSFDYILQKFVNKLNLLKLKHTNVFDQLSSSYCQELSQYCGVNITPSYFKPNKGKRNLYKFAANSFFGKFAQRTDRGKVLFVSSQQELENFALSDNLKDIFCLTDQVCMIELGNSKPKMPNLKYQVYIGAEITALGRITVYKHLIELQKCVDCTIYHVNCDSLFFSLPKSVVMPLKLNDAVGQFKDIFKGDIVSYISFGPKQYCVSLFCDSSLISETRISGLSLKLVTENFDFQNLFEKLLSNYEQKVFDSFIFPQVKKRVQLKKFAVNYYSQKFSLTNALHCKRLLCLNSLRLETLPYGYVPDD